MDLSGYGLFACCDFSKGEIVSIYHGNVIEKNVDSIYLITNGEVTLDAGPWLLGNLGDIREWSYLGAHMANDAGWVKEGEEEDENEVKKIRPMFLSTKSLNLWL